MIIRLPMWPQFLSEYFGARDEEQIGKITQAIGGLAQLKLMQGIVLICVFKSCP
ncbi:MAG: hypothetical protein K5696_04090 [Lachnospiraceae bacterium]|nr:hypothetical protein [Lachnospiraceae bacterium]